MNVGRLVVWNCPPDSPIPRYTANDLNQLITAGGLTLSYDNSGNLQGDGSNSYNKTQENRLLGVTGSNRANLRHGPLGRLHQI